MASGQFPAELRVAPDHLSLCVPNADDYCFTVKERVQLEFFTAEHSRLLWKETSTYALVDQISKQRLHLDITYTGCCL